MKRLGIGMLLLSGSALVVLAMPQGATPETHQMPQMMGNMAACPMSLSGTEVAIADTKEGIVITFATKPENVKELQTRVEHWATMHDPKGAGMMPMAAIGSAKYEALPTGARLTLTPKDATTLTKFREQVRAHVEQMKTGDCSMMQQMMQQMMQGMMPMHPK